MPSSVGGDHPAWPSPVSPPPAWGSGTEWVLLHFVHENLLHKDSSQAYLSETMDFTSRDFSCLLLGEWDMASQEVGCLGLG